MPPGGPFGGMNWENPRIPDGLLWDYTTAYMQPWRGPVLPAPPAPPTTVFQPALVVTPPSLPGGVAWEMVAWGLRLTEMVNLVQVGKLNATVDLILAMNAASTTLTDARLGVTSFVSLSPLTLSAAVELAAGTLYIETLNNGSVVIGHTNSGTSDRKFRVLIIG